ncbi:hypothetical protein CDA63_06915 [Hymenobacter amundsenii]|uniref:Uncharacterized protein n=1 Tax=Hymenobacter amundsenii TaxID=2006685 RepID=A0A246FMH3_9BACT|nr:hypothetical protein [Hymenobacter amundsenii]OWP63938.1 hypothetical protein CDA63_06915 [Hymenobacter amundsenii]
MMYVDLSTFFESDVSSIRGKQQLLANIASDSVNNKEQMSIEGNVFRLIIEYNDKKVEIWDAIMDSLGYEQEPYTSTLEDFITSLKAYNPGK